MIVPLGRRRVDLGRQSTGTENCLGSDKPMPGSQSLPARQVSVHALPCSPSSQLVYELFLRCVAVEVAEEHHRHLCTVREGARVVAGS